MNFEGFEWDVGNSDKCRKHGVSIAAIESVIATPVLILNEAANSQVEQRYRAIGVTPTGREAFIVFTMRGGFIKPVIRNTLATSGRPTSNRASARGCCAHREQRTVFGTSTPNGQARGDDDRIYLQVSDTLST